MVHKRFFFNVKNSMCLHQFKNVNNLKKKMYAKSTRANYFPIIRIWILDIFFENYLHTYFVYLFPQSCNYVFRIRKESVLHKTAKSGHFANDQICSSARINLAPKLDTKNQGFKPRTPRIFGYSKLHTGIFLQQFDSDNPD